MRPTDLPIAPASRCLACAFAALFAAAVAMAPASAGATTMIATLDKPTPVSAFDGRVVWSAYDPPAKAFRLMTSSDGVTEAVPVAPRTVAFDADLGPDALGRPSIAYSRCRHEPIGPFRPWSTARGCDLYRFDFATGRETPIAGASTSGRSEYLPSLWRGRVAFVRADGPSEAGIRPPRIYVRSLVSGRETLLPGGRRSRPRPPDGAGPDGLDLGDGRLAFNWRSGDGFLETNISDVRVDTLDGAGTLVGTSFSPSTLDTPSLVGRRVYYGVTDFGSDDDHRFYRYDVATGRHWSSGNLPGITLAAATDGHATYVVYAAVPSPFFACGGPVELGPARCTLVRVDPLTYRRYRASR